ncbi:IS5 family transposase [Lyngbya confervoides]|uniref:IS5 family transposase n=1 Tax=Lyngbya confervoides BDU141951 TaxID=1574623 RepID=A0ABD4T5S8_9CYAN|nr:IS5 family transposase [Lyngbya confervoides]MCM1983607.1 IS5 family transposase [Lyngbya confervoides BDU141951]
MAKQQRYGSDLSDQEWERIKPLLPPDKTVGRWRTSNLRDILDAIFYRADNGIKWRNLPKDFPPWQTVYGYFRLWVRLGVWEQINEALVRQVRVNEGREEEPSLAITDSQSMKLGEKGGQKLGLMDSRR